MLSIRAVSQQHHYRNPFRKTCSKSSQRAADIIIIRFPCCSVNMSYFASTFYYFFGFVSALYVVILWNKVVNKSEETSIRAPVKFYLNLFFLDRKELLRNIVRSKVSRSNPVLRALSKRAAVALLNNVIVDKVAANLCQVIPQNLGKMGIRCKVSVIYSKNSFLCIEVSMHKVDIPALVEFGGGESAAQKVKDLIERFSFPKLNELINYLMLTYMFQRKLMDKLPVQLKQKLQDKMYADLEIFSCTEDELGPYLAQTLFSMQTPPKEAPPAIESPPTSPIDK